MYFGTVFSLKKLTEYKHIFYTLALVLSVRVCVCVCPCVTDVTTTNEPRLRENTREGRDVITQYTRTSTAAYHEIMRRSDNRRIMTASNEHFERALSQRLLAR